MIGKLPNELWIIIIDTLGLQGYTRDCTNLIRALVFSESLVYNYLVTELHKSRWGGWNWSVCNDKKTYYTQILDLWKRTGIDDGLSSEDLINNLNSNTKMYKTIWSYSVFENTKGYNCIYRHIVFDSLNNLSKYRSEYTDCIFKDNRKIDINEVCSWSDLSENSKKEIENTVENLNNSKKLSVDKCIYYDRVKKLLLYKAKGSLI